MELADDAVQERRQARVGEAAAAPAPHTWTGGEVRLRYQPRRAFRGRKEAASGAECACSCG